MILPTEEYRRVASAVPIICVDCLVVNEEGEFTGEALIRRRRMNIGFGGAFKANERS